MGEIIHSPNLASVFRHHIIFLIGWGEGDCADGVDFLKMRLRLRERAEERPMLISVINIIVFVAGRLPVLLVTSRGWVMNRQGPGGLTKNNTVCFLWQPLIAERDRQVTAPLLELCDSVCWDGTLPYSKSAVWITVLRGMPALTFWYSWQKLRRRFNEGIKGFKLPVSYPEVRYSDSLFSTDHGLFVIHLWYILSITLYISATLWFQYNRKYGNWDYQCSRFGPIVPAHPTETRSVWDLGSLQARSTLFFFCFFKCFFFPFVLK